MLVIFQHNQKNSPTPLICPIQTNLNKDQPRNQRSVKIVNIPIVKQEKRKLSDFPLNE